MDEIVERVEKIRNHIGKMVRHFKGNEYLILCIATNTEDESDMVIYKALYGQYRIFARSIDMFASKVDHLKYPDVEQEWRFELI